MPVTNKVLKISQNDFTFWFLAIIYFGILICKAYIVQYHRYVDLNATQCPNCWILPILTVKKQMWVTLYKANCIKLWRIHNVETSNISCVPLSKHLHGTYNPEYQNYNEMVKLWHNNLLSVVMLYESKRDIWKKGFVHFNSFWS